MDAMGVIFRSGHVVTDLLIPFVTEQTGACDGEVIRSAYLEASLGNISPDEFWKRVGLASDLEDEYLSKQSLNPGVKALLSQAKEDGIPVWCLSNDLSRWSIKLRKTLGIEQYLGGSIISSDVGVRKPNKEIYKTLLDSSGIKIEDILFVDDQEKNVTASREVGIESILFKPEKGFSDVKEWISKHAL
ncbi:MAG: HAD-IA family hydrolase [Candidatus Thiodiazotropha sp. (ex Myrtea spinifera)]|nr:HAD-IA family hydrolase [Candidatus Thiodiazotropha sp. (ex Myrtea spinifera)]MCU7829462.1 HAD-IA family hydrolase [Candidatus Thiodiazotropha sp. (ex Myrtea sp. 'scaly one' KF741663)]